MSAPSLTIAIADRPGASTGTLVWDQAVTVLSLSGFSLWVSVDNGDSYTQDSGAVFSVDDDQTKIDVVPSAAWDAAKLYSVNVGSASVSDGGLETNGAINNFPVTFRPYVVSAAFVNGNTQFELVVSEACDVDASQLVLSDSESDVSSRQAGTHTSDQITFLYDIDGLPAPGVAVTLDVGADAAVSQSSGLHALELTGIPVSNPAEVAAPPPIVTGSIGMSRARNGLRSERGRL